MRAKYQMNSASINSMSHIADPVAERTLKRANAIGKRSKKGSADHTEMVNASMKKSLVRVMKAENKMIPATIA